MARFMCILHSDPNDHKHLSPTELERTYEKYRAWFEKIRASGKYVISDKLAEEGGRLLVLQQGKLSITDGPYSEAKEVVAGFITIRADSYEEAVELLRDCPNLAFGGRLEVRRTDPMGCGGE